MVTWLGLPEVREMNPCISQGNQEPRPILRKRQTRKTRILLKSNYLWVFNQVSLALPHLVQRKFSVYVGPNLYLIKKRKEPGQNSKVRKTRWIIYFSPYTFANTKAPTLSPSNLVLHFCARLCVYVTHRKRNGRNLRRKPPHMKTLNPDNYSSLQKKRQTEVPSQPIKNYVISLTSKKNHYLNMYQLNKLKKKKKKRRGWVVVNKQLHALFITAG